MRHHSKNFMIPKEHMALLCQCLEDLFKSPTPAISKRDKAIGLYDTEKNSPFSALYAALMIKPIFCGKYDDGDITDFAFHRYIEAEHEAVFAAIAPAVQPGGWIQVEYEYGNIRRYSFDGSRCISEPAQIVVPSDRRYVVSTRYIKGSMDVDIALHGAYMDYRDAMRTYQQLIDWAHLAKPVSHKHELVELETANGAMRSWIQMKQDKLPQDGAFLVLLEVTTGLVPGIPAGE